MRYHIKDLSSVMGEYQLIRSSPDAPHFVVKKTEPEFLQEKRAAYYSFPRHTNFYHLRSAQEVAALASGFMRLWSEASNQMRELLKEVVDAAHPNPHIETTSKRAYITAFLWLIRLFRGNDQLPCPDVVPNGEGGIDIEWTLPNIFVSVQIHQSNPQNDRVYFKKEAGFSSTELNLENLQRLLNE